MMAEKVAAHPVTALTILCAVLWAVSMVVRIWRPDWPAGPAADSVMTLMAAYWFASKKGTP